VKTLSVILNHNLPDYTDMLYESLKPYERKDYELIVFDNGSSKEGRSKYTTYGTDSNVYFGGGFNAAMQLVMEDDQYDSLLFLNNDLTVHPYNFVRVLREVMFDGTPVNEADEIAMLYGGDRTPKFDVVSPTFYNIEPKGQCHWKTMHNYGQKETRTVPFIDFQCPLISKRVLQEVKEIDPLLIYGWGIDTLFAIICQQKGWKMGVVDRLSVLHHNSLTVKRGVAGINVQQYCQLAEQGQRDYFAKVGLVKEFHKVRELGEKYNGTI
jgi:GT2 family glycosyltransferase